MYHNKSAKKGMKMPKIKLPMIDGEGSPQDEAYRMNMKLMMWDMGILTVADVCLMMKVSRQTVIRWIRSGRLRAFKPGGGRFWRIQKADFKEFVGGKHGRL
jgi:excisionase family DNA binding protein